MNTQVATFGDILSEAMKAKGLIPPTQELPSKKPRKIKKNRGKMAMEVQVVSWDDESFGTIGVSVPGFELSSKTYKEAGVTYCQIFRAGKMPNTLKVTFQAEAKPDVCILQSINGQLPVVTSSPIEPLEVAVEWRKNKQDSDAMLRPFTRQRGKDNTDLIFLRKDSAFVQLQISLVTRYEILWLCVQEVYAGQPCFARQSEVTDVNVTKFVLEDGIDPLVGFVNPIWDECAYPGADHGKNFKYCSEKLVRFAHEVGAIISYDESDQCSWEPLELDDSLQPIPEGWSWAVPTWFNNVTGYGYVVCQDGELCFVHFSTIQFLDDKGQPASGYGKFPFLAPMEAVVLKYKMTDKGRQATAVRTAH